MTTRDLFCFGHRGAAGHEPENTLRSVRRALEFGAHGVEVDVRLADGHLMVIHDATLKRTTSGHGRVSEQSFSYLRSLDAGMGERIPTLSEIIDIVDRRAVLNIELKDPHSARPVAEMIAAYVEERGWNDENFLVSAFDHSLLVEVKRIRPQIRIGALLEKSTADIARIAHDLDAWSIQPKLRTVKPELVEEAHRHELKVFVYTVNQPKDIARMKDMGVDGVFTDFPDRVLGFTS